MVVEGLSSDPSFVDSQGIVYLYLIQPGQYRLKIKTQGGQQCQAQLIVPQNQFQNSENQILETICR